MNQPKAAATLRQAFDDSFAVARDGASTGAVDLVGLELGGAPHAIRLTELAGIFSDRKVTRLPSALPELTGITGIRGTILPVFDLAALLGYPRDAGSRWLAVAASASVAFAFGTFVGHVRVAPQALATTGARAHVHGVVSVSERVWPVISIRSLVDTLAQHVKET